MHSARLSDTAACSKRLAELTGLFVVHGVLKHLKLNGFSTE